MAGESESNEGLLGGSTQREPSGNKRVLVCASLCVIVLIVVVGVHHGLQQQNGEFARPLAKLKHPAVILISADGFRFGYDSKVPTPNIDKLRLNGIEADAGLIPVFPTLTYPNHYSIVTGLYPAWHGIVANDFSEPDGTKFNQSSLEPKWWLGEPIWVTVANNKLTAATYFWPGSTVKKGDWTCPEEFCKEPYNKTDPHEGRVKQVLKYFDKPLKNVPSHVSLYFESPDKEGHAVGPDGPKISVAVSGIDTLVGQLIDGLKTRGVFEDVTIILLGDHGMVSTCETRVINIADFDPFGKIEQEWIDSWGALLTVRPPRDQVNSTYSQMETALNSTGLKNVTNGKHLKLYKKEGLPPRLNYSSSDRVAPIVGLADEGFIVLSHAKEKYPPCGGAHGYDNALTSMRSIFIAHGPQFRRGVKVPSFENVELYNLFTTILKLDKKASHNGTEGFPSRILLPEKKDFWSQAGFKMRNWFKTPNFNTDASI